MQIVDTVLQAFSEHTNLNFEEVKSLAERPPRPELGDLALPCFRLAKTLHKAPALIAKEVSEGMNQRKEKSFDCKAAGPYVNVFFHRESFAQNLFEEIDKAEGFVDQRNIGNGKMVVIDYSSPNIAKPFHVGHAFTTLLGEALAKLHEYLGYRVLRLNYLGDYGTQFGKLISAWKRWGDNEALESQPIKELTRVYVKFHAEAEENPELEVEAREYFRKLENGEEEEKNLWQRFRDLSLEEFNRLYDRLGIRFDNYNGESFYSEFIPSVVEELDSKGLLEESEGAQVVNLDEFNLNPCLILKSNGTTIYSSRDLASIKYRERTWNFDKNIYVVGQEQKNHFQQVFAVLKKMGDPKADACVHVSFGRLRFEDEVFSTRKGNVILLEDLLNETVAKVHEIIRENNHDEMSEEEMAETAEKVGLATVKHSYLRNGREKDIIFSWEEMLDFDGDTAPYLLYTYARCKSLLRKSGLQQNDLEKADVKLLIEDEEYFLLKEISQLQSACESAVEEYEPCILMRQVTEIARSFNRYYHQSVILKLDDAELRLARLALCNLVSKQMRFALSLLGIDVVERM